MGCRWARAGGLASVRGDVAAGAVLAGGAEFVVAARGDDGAPFMAVPAVLGQEEVGARGRGWREGRDCVSHAARSPQRGERRSHSLPVFEQYVCLRLMGWHG